MSDVFEKPDLWSADESTAFEYSADKKQILAEVNPGIFDVLISDKGDWRETGNFMKLKHPFLRWMPIPSPDNK